MRTADGIKLIQTDNLMKFYKGRDWMELRLTALRRDAVSELVSYVLVFV
ncbi:MAG: hypothetical protein ACQEW5_24900 [Bacillota bacterium]